MVPELPEKTAESLAALSLPSVANAVAASYRLWIYTESDAKVSANAEPRTRQHEERRFCPRPALCRASAAATAAAAAARPALCRWPGARSSAVLRSGKRRGRRAERAGGAVAGRAGQGGGAMPAVLSACWALLAAAFLAALLLRRALPRRAAGGGCGALLSIFFQDLISYGKTKLGGEQRPAWLRRLQVPKR